MGQLYKDLYEIGKKINKRDRLGVHSQIEEMILKCLRLSIKSALVEKTEKIHTLRELQIELETIKHLVRLEHEMEILTSKKYWELSEQLINISKQTASWYNYTKRSH